MEIGGIPKEIWYMKLDKTVINLFHHLPEPVACTLDDIEAVHRIAANSDTTIVKVKSRKLVQKVKDAKKNLNKTDFYKMKRNTKIYVNDNLCRHENVGQ